ncbi:MAG: hypothetical protein CMP10_12840 [Zetaproteobacteria bacterium]|nr:hypothetical protein [Pseudobdellovibrionaceae bacterium]
MKKLTIYCLIKILFMNLACAPKVSPGANENNIVLDSRQRFTQSTPSGNLIATALKDELQVDIVFYPSRLLREDQFALLNNGTGQTDQIDKVLDLFPSGDPDKITTGVMKGSKIVDFILSTAQENAQLELQTAGLNYHIDFLGGVIQQYYVTDEDKADFDQSAYYRVAISDYFLFHPDTFPGYRYGHGLNFDLKLENGNKTVSAKDALLSWLEKTSEIPLFDEIRANINRIYRKEIDTPVSPSQIQGTAHISPLLGHKVTVSGVVTAIGKDSDSGETRIFIQGMDDQNPLTSDAIPLSVPEAIDTTNISVSDVIEIKGVVYELATGSGLTKTTIKEIEFIKVTGESSDLPLPILIGTGGLMPPTDVISSWNGNLNLKDQLKISDAIDFWESLEGMRVEFLKPSVVGFSGGKSKANRSSAFINVFIAAQGTSDSNQISASNGRILDSVNDKYSPDIVLISDKAPTKGLSGNSTFQIGDQLPNNLVGVFNYERNTFGDGEFVFHPTKGLTDGSPLIPLEDKPKTSLVAAEDQLTFAFFNVENLAGNQDKRNSRIQEIADSIKISLKCPDIITFEEIQDFNGADFSGNSDGLITLNKIIKMIDCNKTYKPINIDPQNHREGGEPGGNIRVAMIYNSDKVGFQPKGNPGPLTETVIEEDGHLNQNPGRIFPNDPVFQSTRRSLVAEFTFKNETIFVIGNHWNSKLSDSARYGAEQPFVSKSDNRRSQIASKINLFVQLLEKKNPDAKIIVGGDFNAYSSEDSIRILMGNELKNLMTWKDIVPANQRYTASYNGLLQSIDFIFANKSCLKNNPELEIIHINTDYMGRISDHDPLISRLTF